MVAHLGRSFLGLKRRGPVQAADRSQSGRIFTCLGGLTDRAAPTNFSILQKRTADRTSVQEGAPAARRAMAALEALSRLPEGASLASLSRSLVMSPSSLLALLATLRSAGYVARKGDRYHVAAGVATLGATAAACLGIGGAFERARQRLEGSVIGSELPGGPAERLAVRTGGLSGDELQAFLQQPLIAVLAYQNEAGYPSTVPVWYAGVREPGDRVVFWVVPGPRARWAEQLQRDPRVSLTVSEGEAPLRRVNAEGVASVLRDPSYAAELWSELLRRYAPADPVHDPLGGLEMVVRIDPARVVSWRGLTQRPRSAEAA